MARLIDADALKEKLRRTNRYFDVKFDIDKAPTVDAVEVVRCKDCKYSTPDIMSEDFRACWQYHTVMPNDGFCSYGERKEVSEDVRTTD